MREKIDEIFNKIKNLDIDQNEIKNLEKDVIKYLNSFADYFNQVVRMEIFCKGISVWNQSDEYIYSQMDEDRRIKHDLCIYACDELNNMCKELKLPMFFNGNINDRNEIAAFCGCIISDIYLDGICEERSFDELIMHFSKENNYTPTQIIDEWNEEIGG